MLSPEEAEVEQLAKFQQACRDIGIFAMTRVQAMSRGDETEFQYGMTLVIRQLTEHLGLSLAAQKCREEFEQGVRDAAQPKRS